MVKEALEFLANLQTPKNPITHEVNGVHYEVTNGGTLGKAIALPDLRHRPGTLLTGTLSGFIDAFKARVVLGTAVHIASPTLVRLIDLVPDETFGTRDIHIQAQHSQETRFVFDKFYEPEEFLLAFRASFYFNEEAVKVQQLCSTVQAGQGVSVSDDGISQEVTTVSGTMTRAAVTLPADGVPLIPWRTFREANPVESKFLLRMKGVKDKLPQIALFEIDAKWQIETIASVRRYLKGHLPEGTVIIA
jgi:hypothetical protein